jgi:DNA-binding CsgD family transcriptional regulator
MTAPADNGRLPTPAWARAEAPADRPVVGRETELARIERFLDDLANRSLALVLEGEAGIGKTTLWSAGLAVARARHIEILACRAVESETRLAFSALADLLEAVPEAAFGALPGPQRRALDVALLRAGPEDQPPNPRAIAVATLGVLRALAQDRPVLVAVDDLPWLDRASAAALEFALRRLDAEPVGLLATVQSEGAFGTAQDRRVPPLSRIDRLVLGPLSLGAFGAVLDTRSPRAWRRPSLVVLHGACGGNPFFGLELAEALAARGRELRPGEALPVPGSLQGLVRARLARLTRPAGEVVLLAAAASRPTVALLIAASTTSARARDGLDAAEAAGVIETIGREVRFVHPMLRSLVYADATATHRRTVHRRLAKASEHPEERARHLALGAEGPDEPVAAELETAALAAYLRGACDAAAELAELALDLTPTGAAARGRRLVHAGEFHFAAFDPEQARQRLEEASVLWEPGPARADALWRLAKVIRYSGTADAAADLLRRALGEPGSGPGLAASIHRDLGFVLANSGEPGGDEHYRAALELARQAADRELVAQMLGVVAFAEFASGNGLRPELIRPALRDATWTAHLPMELRPRVTISHALQYSDDLDAARSLLLEEHHAALERGAETDLPLVLVFLVELETWAGRYDLAGQYAEQGYAAALSSGACLPVATVHGARAMLRACRGEVGGARSDADAAIEIGRRGGWTVPPLWGTHARGLVQLSLGDAAGAHQVLHPVTQLLLRPGGRHVLVSRLLPDDIEAMTRLGALADAERLLRSFQAMARASESNWARATVARCQALVSSARGQQDTAVAALSEAFAAHERLGMPFEFGRTLLVAGQVHRRARHKLEARAHLDAARDLFERLEAPLWAERTVEELSRIGLSRARSSDLSAAERRVAELVAGGRTNREIAEELFMGRRTVEAHVARIYKKLGTRRRTQLGPALQSLNAPEPITSPGPLAR